jgi:hypothetical protein
MKSYSGWSKNFEICDILGKIVDPASTLIYYLIRWEGFPIEESSWVKKNDVSDSATIELYIQKFSIPFKKLKFDSTLHRKFTDSLLSSTNENLIVPKYKKKTETLFSKVLHNNSSSNTNFSTFTASCAPATNSSDQKSILPKISVAAIQSFTSTVNSVLSTTVSKMDNSSWFAPTLDFLQSVGYWQIEPFVYKTKLPIWKNFIFLKKKIEIENFIINILTELQWTKYYPIQQFLVSTHPTLPLSGNNIEFFRIFFFSSYSTHRIYIFLTVALITRNLEFIRKDYRSKTANHRRPLTYGIQYHNGNHFYFILFNVKLKKFIIADSMKKADKEYYIHSVLYLNYLIQYLDKGILLELDSNKYKVNVSATIPALEQNQIYNFNANLSTENKKIICSQIGIWKEFWEQPNLVDCGLYGWLLLYSL